jgi:hypothetical protein
MSLISKSARVLANHNVQLFPPCGEKVCREAEKPTSRQGLAESSGES